jgi:NADPH:quinone reductase
MRAAVCRAHGGPENVEVDELSVPVPGPGEVRVRVRCAAVNFPDVLLVSGGYQVKVPTPFTPGSELAGIVDAVGDGVTRFRPGEAVFGAVMVGAFAEQAVLPESSLQPLPAGVDFEAGAAFGVVYGTAYHSLRSVAELAAGEWLCVLGAAGGVGLAAVDIGVALGARVVAVASAADKLELCRSRGATATIDYTREDLRVRLREVTEGGADVVVDPVGGAAAEQALRSMRWGGRFVTVGFASGEIPKIPLNLVLLKGVVIKGFEMRTFGDHVPDLVARDREELEELLSSGRIRPYVGARFPLADTAGALRHVADRRALGKVVIEMDGPGGPDQTSGG